MCENCKPTTRFHETDEAYHTPKGVLPEDTLEHVAGYLADLQKSAQHSIPTLKVWTDTAMSHPSYTAWVENEDRDFVSDPFRDQIRDIMGNLQNMDRSSRPQLLPGTTPDQRKSNASAYIKQLHRWISDRTQTPIPSTIAVPELIAAVGNQWLLAGFGENVGTFPKRVAKMLWKTYNHKLTSQQIETLGNIASAGVSQDKSHTLTFDQDYTNGDAAAYCNAASCWWNDERQGVREAFEDADGYAIREWDEDTGPVSRCFIIWNEDKKCYIIFNAYGGLSLTAFGRLLSIKWGMIYTPIFLKNGGSYSGKIYINSGAGIAIGNPEIVSSLEGKTIDLRIPEPDICKCCCGCVVDEDEVYTREDGTSYCNDCYHAIYERCSNCSADFLREYNELHDCNGESYCTRCARGQGYRECADCDTWSDELEDCPSGMCCEDCCEPYTRCDQCDTLHNPADMTDTVEGERHCSACYVEPEEEPEDEEPKEIPQEAK